MLCCVMALCSLSTACWVTRTASSATSCRSASKTTVLAVPTEWWAWPSSSYETSWRRATAPAGACWDNASTWTTPASQPCASSPSAPTTMWPRSSWGWSLKRVRPRRADEERDGGRVKRQSRRSPDFTIWEGSQELCSSALPSGLFLRPLMCLSCCWLFGCTLPSSLTRSHLHHLAILDKTLKFFRASETAHII